MDQLDIIRKDFDRIAQLEDTTWNHNRHYHKSLLQYIPFHCQVSLDIGCGTGEFSRLLAERSEKVIGLDLSTEMLKRAENLSQDHPEISYQLENVMEYPLEPEQYDCIVSIATMHHLPVELILKRVKEALKPGGVFLILDLYQEETLSDLLVSAIASPINKVIGLVKTGRWRHSEEERQAWGEHGKNDEYMTLKEIRRISGQILPGVKVQRHLFWRYSLVWQKSL